MSRSLKKGPYCDPKLLKKIQEQNKAGKKEVIRPGLAVPPSSRISSDTLFPSTTVMRSFRSISLKIGSVIS